MFERQLAKVGVLNIMLQLGCGILRYGHGCGPLYTRAHVDIKVMLLCMKKVHIDQDSNNVLRCLHQIIIKASIMVHALEYDQCVFRVVFLIWGM